MLICRNMNSAYRSVAVIPSYDLAESRTEKSGICATINVVKCQPDATFFSIYVIPS